MRGTRAKKVRRAIYGDLSVRQRNYYRNEKTGQIIRDKFRRAYQITKALWKSRTQ